MAKELDELFPQTTFAAMPKTVLTGNVVPEEAAARLWAKASMRIESIVDGDRKPGSTSVSNQVGVNINLRCICCNCRHTVWFNGDGGLSARRYSDNKVINSNPPSITIDDLWECGGTLVDKSATGYLASCSSFRNWWMGHWNTKGRQ